MTTYAILASAKLVSRNFLKSTTNQNLDLLWKISILSVLVVENWFKQMRFTERRSASYAAKKKSVLNTAKIAKKGTVSTAKWWTFLATWRAAKTTNGKSYRSTAMKHLWGPKTNLVACVVRKRKTHTTLITTVLRGCAMTVWSTAWRWQQTKKDPSRWLVIKIISSTISQGRKNTRMSAVDARKQKLSS